MLLATVLDPRIKDRLFSNQQRIEIKAFLLKEIESFTTVQTSIADDSEVLEPRPKKVAKMSKGSSLIEQLLESKKNEYGAEEKASSKAIQVSHLKFN